MNKKGKIAIIATCAGLVIATAITVPCVLVFGKKDEAPLKDEDPLKDDAPLAFIPTELSANQVNPTFDIVLNGTSYTYNTPSTDIILSGAFRGLNVSETKLIDNKTLTISTEGRIVDTFNKGKVELSDDATTYMHPINVERDIDMSTARLSPISGLNPEELSAKAVKAVLDFGIKKIPYVGPTASKLLGPTLNSILGIKSGASIGDVMNELAKIETMLSNLSDQIEKATTEILNQQAISDIFKKFNDDLTSVATITSTKYQQLNGFVDEENKKSDLYKTLSVAELIDFNSQSLTDYVNASLTLLKYLDGTNISFSNKKGILENALLASCKDSKLIGEAALVAAPYIKEVNSTLAYTLKLMITVLGCKSYVADNLQEKYLPALESDPDLQSILTSAKIEEYSNANNIDSWKSKLLVDDTSGTSIAALHNKYFGDGDSNSVSQWYNKMIVNKWFYYVRKYNVSEQGPTPEFVQLNRKIKGVKAGEVGVDRTKEDGATESVVNNTKKNINNALNVSLTESEIKGLFEHILKNTHGAFAEIDKEEVTTTYVNIKPMQVLKDYGFQIPSISGNPLFISSATGSYSEHAVFAGDLYAGSIYNANLNVNATSLNKEYQYQVSSGALTSQFDGFKSTEFYKYYSNTDTGSSSLSKDPNYVFYFFDHADLEINSKDEFATFIKSIENGTTYDKLTIKLNCDIDLANEPYSNFWSTAKNTNKFLGEFNGNGHKISNLYDHIDTDRAGLFRTLGEGATVRNLTIENVDILGNNSKEGFGAIAGVVDGNVKIGDVIIKNGKIEGQNKVGGLVGVIKSGSLVVSGCQNHANIKARNNYAGGIIGNSDSKQKQSITSSTNFGDVEAINNSAGGICGRYGRDDSDPSHTIMSCINNGNIKTGVGSVGGIVGHLDSDAGHLIMNNTNNGNVSTASDHPAGGIIGYSEGGGSFKGNKNHGSISGKQAGGIVGENEDDSIDFTGCENTGSISSKNNGGGIAGWLGNNKSDKSYTLTESKNLGKIYAENGHAGGIVGHLSTDSSNHNFYKCSNEGEVTSNSNHAGGIVGYSEGGGNFNDCMNKGAIKGKNAGGIIGENEDDSIDFSGSSNSGNVTANVHGGGIAGYIGSKSQDKAFIGRYCTNTGDITAGSNAGGIIGCLRTDNKKHNFTGCSNEGHIVGNDRAGGIIGYCLGGGNFTECINKGVIDSKNFAGGIIGENEDDPIDTANCQSLGAVNGAANHTGQTVGYDGNKKKTY